MRPNPPSLFGAPFGLVLSPLLADLMRTLYRCGPQRTPKSADEVLAILGRRRLAQGRPDEAEEAFRRAALVFEETVTEWSLEYAEILVLRGSASLELGAADEVGMGVVGSGMWGGTRAVALDRPEACPTRNLPSLYASARHVQQRLARRSLLDARCELVPTDWVCQSSWVSTAP